MNIEFFNLPDVPLNLTGKLVSLSLEDKSYVVGAAYSNVQSAFIVFSEDYTFKVIKVPFEQSNTRFIDTYNGKIICGNSELISVDLITEEIDIYTKNLGITDGPWGGCVFKDYAILGCSEPDGFVVIFDLKNKDIVKKIKVPQDSYFVYEAIKTPDDLIFIPCSSPKPSYILFDPKTLTSFSKYLEFNDVDFEAVNCCFLNDKELFINSSTCSYVLSYPECIVKYSITWPESVSFKMQTRNTPCINNKPILWDNLGANLYQFDLQTQSFIRFNKSPIKNEMYDNVIAGIVSIRNQKIIGLKNSGYLFEVLQDGSVHSKKEVEIFGGIKGHEMKLVEKNGQKKILGTGHFNQRLWEVDIISGRCKYVGKSGPGVGQVDCMIVVNETNELYFGSYSSCSLMKYNPFVDDKPVLLKTFERNQCRPIGLVYQKGVIWMITRSKRGTRGGALIRYDLNTKEVEYYIDFFNGLTPTSMIYDKQKKELLIAVSVFSEGYTPLDGTAGIFYFSTEKMKCVDFFKPIEKYEYLHILCKNNSRQLVITNKKPMSLVNEIYLYHVDKKSFKKILNNVLGLREIHYDQLSNKYFGASSEGIFELRISGKVELILLINSLGSENKNFIPKFLNIDKEGSLYGISHDQYFYYKNFLNKMDRKNILC